MNGENVVHLYTQKRLGKIQATLPLCGHAPPFRETTLVVAPKEECCPDCWNNRVEGVRVLPGLAIDQAKLLSGRGRESEHPAPEVAA